MNMEDRMNGRWRRGPPLALAGALGLVGAGGALAAGTGAQERDLEETPAVQAEADRALLEELGEARIILEELEEEDRSLIEVERLPAEAPPALAAEEAKEDEPFEAEEARELEEPAAEPRTGERALDPEQVRAQGELADDEDLDLAEEAPLAERQVASGRVHSVDKWAGIIRLEDEAFRAHPAQLVNLEVGQLVSVTFAEEEGERWVHELRVGAPADEALKPPPAMPPEEGGEGRDLGEPPGPDDPLVLPEGAPSQTSPDDDFTDGTQFETDVTQPQDFQEAGPGDDEQGGQP
jgi:hypothetical protein